MTLGTLGGLLHIRVIREGFFEEVTFEPKPERQRKPATRQSGEGARQEESMAGANAARRTSRDQVGTERNHCGWTWWVREASSEREAGPGPRALWTTVENTAAIEPFWVSDII